MHFEIDFLAVGDGEKGGDASAIRVWDGNGTQLVFVVDGGTKDSGTALVNLIKTYYSTTTVNAVFSTHPDGDHASGLTEVLESLAVQNLVMHKPWEHADHIRHLFDNPSLTTGGLKRKIREELAFAHELNTIATRKRIPVTEPFAGAIYYNGVVRVLGPSFQHYQGLLPHFRATPEPGIPLDAILPLLQRQSASRLVPETMAIETLTDSADHFSAENSSSSILLFTFGSDKVLFTGDADNSALASAIASAHAQGIALNDLYLLDVPHHGSRHNVGPTALNAIRAKYAHISAPAASPKHPAKQVVNALIRRGAAVYATAGRGICYHSAQVPSRTGWTGVEALRFSDLVED